jgi:hypothetical protein
MSNRSITGYHLNTFTIRISQRFSSAWEFQMGNFQKYWSQNVGQDFIILDFLVGGISCRRKRCVRENNVSRAWDPVHVGDKALTRKTPAKRGRVNRYDIMAVISVISWRLLVEETYLPAWKMYKHLQIVSTPDNHWTYGDLNNRLLEFVKWPLTSYFAKWSMTSYYCYILYC